MCWKHELPIILNRKKFADGGDPVSFHVFLNSTFEKQVPVSSRPSLSSNSSLVSWTSLYQIQTKDCCCARKELRQASNRQKRRWKMFSSLVTAWPRSSWSVLLLSQSLALAAKERYREGHPKRRGEPHDHGQALLLQSSASAPGPLRLGHADWVFSTPAHSKVSEAFLCMKGHLPWYPVKIWRRTRSEGSLKTVFQCLCLLQLMLPATKCTDWASRGVDKEPPTTLGHLRYVIWKKDIRDSRAASAVGFHLEEKSRELSFWLR